MNERFCVYLAGVCIVFAPRVLLLRMCVACAVQWVGGLAIRVQREGEGERVSKTNIPTSRVTHRTHPALVSFTFVPGVVCLFLFLSFPFSLFFVCRPTVAV